MSVQDSEEQFKHEQMEDEAEELQDSSIEAPLSVPDESISESFGVPAADASVLSSDESGTEEEDEPERPAVPAIGWLRRR